MALKKLEADVEVISKLGDNPGMDNGLTTAELKAKFDEAAKVIKDYINNYLIGELDMLVDVEALLDGILDTTFSATDKAAQAYATGSALGALRGQVANALAQVVRSGDFVLDTGKKLAASQTGTYTVFVNSGVVCMQGNVASVAGKALTLTSGATGMNRRDLIVVRCTCSAQGALTFSPALITGTATSGTASDPAYSSGDLNGGGAAVRDFPIYRITFSGTSMSIGKLFAEGKKAVRTATIGTRWSGSAPYTQTVSVPGVLASDVPRVTPVYSSTLSTAIAQKEAWGMVSMGQAVAGGIKFTCLEEKPTTSIPIQVEV